MPFISHTPPPKRCNSREHKPPGHIVLQPGDHVWKCPDCGEKTVVHVPEPPQWMIRYGIPPRGYLTDKKGRVGLATRSGNVHPDGRLSEFRDLADDAVQLAVCIAARVDDEIEAERGE